MPLSFGKGRTDEILKNVRALTKDDVLVGFADTGAERQPEPGEKGTPLSNAAIAYLMETGSPANNIPARPFLAPGVESAEPAIIAQMRKAGEAALDGKLSDIAKAQMATGLVAQSAVKAKITSNTPPPLSQRTLDERKQRGVTRTNTLVDSGQMLNAVTFVVRPKGS